MKSAEKERVKLIRLLSNLAVVSSGLMEDIKSGKYIEKNPDNLQLKNRFYRRVHFLKHNADALERKARLWYYAEVWRPNDGNENKTNR